MSSLLSKTRMLNKILQKSGTEPVAFEDICKLLSEVLECNVYIASRKGKILGYTFAKDFECHVMKKKIMEERRFPADYNEKLLNITETISNYLIKVIVFLKVKEIVWQKTSCLQLFL